MDWVQSIAPLAGVVVGAMLAARGSQSGFVRSRVIAEIDNRRTVSSDFTAALWAYQSRVARAREIARDRTGGARDWTGSPDLPPATFDIRLAFRRQEECQQAFARLRFHSSKPAQDAGFEAMEALTKSLMAVLSMNLDLGDASWAEYVGAQASLMTAFNEEIAASNLSLYAFSTVWWRIVLGRLRRSPLPYEIGVETPSELVDPREGVRESPSVPFEA